MTAQEQRLANEFLDHATEFVDASERLYARQPFLLHPTFYCAIHGVELALKSYLAAHGYTKSRLASRDFGHNLSRLLTEAFSCGDLQSHLSVRDQRTITASGKSYSRKAFEYPELVTTVGIGNWRGVARKLICHARRKVNPKA
jgi:hypothetical protein